LTSIVVILWLFSL